MLEIIHHGPVREIRLARPPANAINPELIEALSAALEDAGQSAEAVVVSGRDGMFSAGLDVPQLVDLDRAQMLSFWHSFIRTTRQIAAMPVPTVFALNGHAPAGGIVLALFADYRIMPRGPFKTGLNEVQVGLVIPPQVHRVLTRLIGAHRTERICVAGEMMEAQKALEIGLVDELAEDPQRVVTRAIEWCQELLALPRRPMLLTRTMARADLQGMFEDTDSASVDQFIGIWFEESSQRALRQLVARLTGKE